VFDHMTGGACEYRKRRCRDGVEGYTWSCLLRNSASTQVLVPQTIALLALQGHSFEAPQFLLGQNTIHGKRIGQKDIGTISTHEVMLNQDREATRTDIRWC